MAWLEILRAGFDGGQFGIGPRGQRLGLDHADMGKIPGHRAGAAQLPLPEQHAHFRGGAVDVVGQAFDHQRHLVRREAFIDDMLVMHRLAGQAGTFFDRPVQRFLGHGELARLLDDQPQARVRRRVGPVARCDHDVLGQLSKNPAPGIGGQVLAFCFPLRAHEKLSLMCRHLKAPGG